MVSLLKLAQVRPAERFYCTLSSHFFRTQQSMNFAYNRSLCLYQLVSFVYLLVDHLFHEFVDIFEVFIGAGSGAGAGRVTAFRSCVIALEISTKCSMSTSSPLRFRFKPRITSARFRAVVPMDD